jgi:hypothetical protein
LPPDAFAGAAAGDGTVLAGDGVGDATLAGEAVTVLAGDGVVAAVLAGVAPAVFAGVDAPPKFHAFCS